MMLVEIFYTKSRGLRLACFRVEKNIVNCEEWEGGL